MEETFVTGAASAAPSSALENFPAELRGRGQWICWRSVERRGKCTKAPVSPMTGQEINHLSASNQHGFDVIAHCMGSPYVDGVAFVFSEEDPYCGVDLDGVLDPETGEIAPEATEIIERLDSYTEFSPSGTGVHIIVRGSLPGPRNRQGNVEVYDRRRYFTATGRHMRGTPATVEDRQEALTGLYRELFGDAEDDGGGELAEPVSPEMDDDEVLTRCREARNAEKFERMWSGDTSGYGSRSEADQALVSLLAFFTQDEQQIVRLWKQSGLARDKLDREDYVRRTVRKALPANRSYFGAERDQGTVTLVDDDTIDAADATNAVAEDKSAGDRPPTNTTYANDAADTGRALPPAPPFPVGVLPPDLARFVKEAAASLVCRPEFVALPMLATLSSAAGASRVFQVKAKWKAYPSLWMAIVAPPSAKKTPGWEVATEPAQDQQAESAKRWQAEKEDYEERLRIYEAKKKALKKGDVPPKPPEEPLMEHNLAQDATIEALAVILSENPRGVLIAHDELSAFFRSMDQYKPGGKGSDRQKYLSLWSSTLIKVDRKKDDPILVRTPVVSVAGSLQPAVVEDMYKATSQGGDDGMIHRFLLSYPEPLRVLDDWSDEEISPATEYAYRRIYEGLRKLQPDEEGRPVPVYFTEVGRERFRAEKRAINAEMLRPGFPETLQYAWGKMDSQLARLALLFCLVRSVTEGTEEAVTEEDVERAARLVEYFRAHTRRVHGLLRQESKDGRLLHALGEVLGEQPSGEWKGRSADLRRALLERGVHDVPDRPEDLSAKLLRLSEKVDGLSVKRGWIGKERAITVAITPLSPTPGVGDVGSVGAAAPVSPAGR